MKVLLPLFFVSLHLFSNSLLAQVPIEMPIPTPVIPNPSTEIAPLPPETALPTPPPPPPAEESRPAPRPALLKKINGNQSPASDDARPKVRDAKSAPIFVAPTPTPMPDIIPAAISTAPGSIQKIFLITTSPTIDKGEILKVLKILHSEFDIKFLLVEHKATKEIPNHVGADGKLSFDDFANSVRKKYAFKSNERLLFLFEGDLLRADGTPVLFSVTAADLGISVLSLKLIKTTPEKIQERLLKQFRTIAGLFYASPSTCGLMKNAVTLEELDSMSPAYCPEDKVSFRTLKLLR